MGVQKITLQTQAYSKPAIRKGKSWSESETA